MRALVLGASGGIGAAVCDRLARDGARVTRLSRRDDGLDLTDPTTPGPLAARLERPFDLIFNATGALGGGGTEAERTAQGQTRYRTTVAVCCMHYVVMRVRVMALSSKLG